MCAEHILIVRFVNAIEANPCLWDINSKKKKNKALVKNTWDIISKQFNEPVVTCRERWRNIRTAFLQSIKRNSNESSGKKQYYLRPHLEFLMPSIGMGGKTPVKSFSDTEDYRASESEEDIKPGAFLEKSQANDLPDSFRNEMESKSTLFQSSGNLTAKETLTSYCNIHRQSDGNIPNKRHKRSEEDLDSDMAFFKSLLRDVRKMNDRQNRKFRFKVMQIANEILDEDDQEQPQKGCGCKHKPI